MREPQTALTRQTGLIELTSGIFPKDREPSISTLRNWTNSVAFITTASGMSSTTTWLKVRTLSAPSSGCRHAADQRLRHCAGVSGLAEATNGVSGAYVASKFVPIS